MWAPLIVIVASMIVAATAAAQPLSPAKPTYLSQLNADLSALCSRHFECRGDTCPAQRAQMIERQIAKAWNKREEILISLPPDRARAVGADFPSRECQIQAKKAASRHPVYARRTPDPAPKYVEVLRPGAKAGARGGWKPYQRPAPPTQQQVEELTPAGAGPAPQSQPSLPEFPWPPPLASSSYVLPNYLFETSLTVGAVAAAIISALERNGYVERSFFRTEPGGIALVTRLERIKNDGSSFAERQRWPTSKQSYASTNDLARFLYGLFFIDPGRYRVIVFVLQDLPFSQSSKKITGEEARLWLNVGANILPPEISERPFGSGHCTVLIYEFSSDGTAVRVVESRLTGKQHLEKAGVLSLLEKAN